MTEQRQEFILTKEKERKKNLFLFELSRAVERFGSRSFAVWYNNLDYDFPLRRLIIFIISLFRIAIRLPLPLLIFGAIIAIFRIQDAPLYIIPIAYVVIYLIVLFVGMSLRQHFEDILSVLGKECNDDWLLYFVDVRHENNIHRTANFDQIIFEDGLTYTNFGNLSAPALRHNVNFTIYNKSIYEEETECRTKLYSLPLNEQTMDKNIASVEFNKKFCIILDKKDEKECMKYFSPSLIAGMVKSKVLPKCQNIKIKDNCLTAKIDEPILRPSEINLFVHQKLSVYYARAKEYCENFAAVAKTVHDDISNIDF